MASPLPEQFDFIFAIGIALTVDHLLLTIKVEGHKIPIFSALFVQQEKVRRQHQEHISYADAITL